MDAAEYARRRQRVLEAIAPGALLIFAAPVAIRNNDVEHEYRQDSDLVYLTGFEEPESAALLSSQGEHQFVLFVRSRDPEREVWEGPRVGVEGAVHQFGADLAHPYSELADKLPDLLRNTERLYYQLGLNRAHDDTVLSAIRRLRARAKEGVAWPTQLVEPSVVVHEQRLIKASTELEQMMRAVSITARAHLEAMARTRPGMHEYQVEALLRAQFREQGARRPAYAPVVGSGPNATVLHYVRNDRKMSAGELLLIDAGCEYDYYASDVTRTFPVSGQFSKAQAELYDLVLQAQLAGIAAVRPGATLDDVHQVCATVLTEGLVDLGMIAGPVPSALEEKRYKPYFMHRTGHFIGMDVHDVGCTHRQGKPRPLQEGMVLTVEPGLYVAAQAADAPEQYRGIGIRIEDVVLVTREGSRVLSDEVPKRREDVERACTR